MHAEMGPAVWILRSAGLVTAKSAGSRPIQPNGKPSLGRPVVQNYWIAKGIVEGTLSVRFGQARESETAVGRDRCAGNIDGVKITTSRVVVRHNNLVGVIRVRSGERF